MDHHPEGPLGVREAARRCNMTHEALRKILNGTTARPAAETLMKLSRGLGLQMRALREAVAQDAGYTHEVTTAQSGQFEYTIASLDALTPEQLAEVIRRAEQAIHDTEGDDN